MIPRVLALAAVVPLCWLIALAAAPATARSRRRDLERRDRFLRHHPQLASAADVDRLLLAHLSRGDVDLVRSQARDAGVSLRLLWVFVDRTGVALLALALAGGCLRRDLEDHLDGTRPLDTESLALVAELECRPLPAFRETSTTAPVRRSARRATP